MATALPHGAVEHSHAWTARVFGLDVHGAFPAPGLAEAAPVAGSRPVVNAAIACDGETVDWPASEGTRVLHYRFEDGSTIMAVDHHPELGYRLFALEQGTHFVSADGRSIWSAPLNGDSWRWQRYLVGQVLPLAALLNGLEVLHASVVSVRGQALAFVAASGMGKTSLALNLVLRGNRFLADDAAALDLDGGLPIVHPGPGLANLRRSEHGRIGNAGRARLGRILGSDREALRVVLERDHRPALLRAIYLLERSSHATVPLFERLPQPSLPLLLGCRYVCFVNTPARLAHQLEIHSAIARHVRVYRLHLPSCLGAAELSSYVEAHVDSELA